MPNDLFNQASRQRDRFLENVRDYFGQSITDEVFSPIVKDISGLIQVGEYFQSKALELDQIHEEIRNIRTKTDDE